MSEQLRYKLDLAERAIKIASFACSPRVSDLWRQIQQLSLDENNDQVFDRAGEVLEILRGK